MDSDSFFGFDPTQADEDTGFSYDREDDDDFDALNDETFGTAASTGDWEDRHRQLSGLLENNTRLDHSSSSGRPTPGGVGIPASRGDDFFSAASSSLSNGLSNLHNIGSGHSYNTPPKTSSLIDPVKLSESPGNGIWAPEPSMLEKIGFSRSGNNVSLFGAPPSQASSNIFNLLQQAPSTAKQRQMNMLTTSQQQQQQQQQNQRMLYNLSADGTSSMFGSSDNSTHRFQQQQQTLLGNLSGMSSGSLSGLEGVQQRVSGLPLGFSGNVKSVADLGMEMRLQQLKNQANAADRVVRAEDLERQATSRSSSNLGKPLQPFFTQQQQLQQIQQNQLVEIQQKRPHQQHNQQPQRVPQFHPLTGQPLNTGGGSSQPLHHPSGNPFNRMQQPNMAPNYQYHMQQQQQQFLLANMGNRQPRANQGHLAPQPLPPPHLGQNYHNFPNHQRNVGGNFGSGQPNFANNPLTAGGIASGVAGMARGNWNNGFDNTNNPVGSGSYFDRRNNGGFNNRGGGNIYEDRRQQPVLRGNKFTPGSGGYDRNNGGGNQRDYGGGYNNNNGNNGMAGGGGVRRDSEAEWEEWERRREEDEYAGLMTPKQKSWLRNIQTMQLATENPYRDDYYYVVYTAKRNRPHPDEPLQIQGLNMLLPALPGDQEKDAGNTYQPPAMENSLGKLQVASVNAPRKIMDVQAVRPDNRSGSTALQLQMRTHRLLLLSIEKLYAQYMELEDLDRKAAYLPDSPTRDSFIRRAKQLAEEMWDVVNTNEANMLAVMTIRKGKTLVANLVARLGPAAAETALGVVLSHLPQLTRNSQPQYQNTLNILWPTADNMLANASPQLLLALASKLLPHLQDTQKAKTSSEGDADAEVSSSEGKEAELIPVLASKFGISVIVGLLLRGEQVYQEIIKYEAWQEFLSRVISVLASVQNPHLTNTLVRDGGVGEASKHPTVSTSTSKKPPAPVVVLGRGQSLSSLTKQRSIAGNLTSSIPTSTAMSSGAGGRCLTPPLPLVAVTASNVTAGEMGPTAPSSVLQQPSAHLARCTEQVQSGALAAAQSALQRLDIATTTSANVTNASSTPVQSQPHNTNISAKGFASQDEEFGGSLES